MRVPKKGMLCGWCGHPVTRHALAVEEFVPDTREGADPARLRKQLYHKKRCWSKELRSRVNEGRANDRLLRTIELAKQTLSEAGGAAEVAQGTFTEEQLVELAIRQVGTQRPQLVSERARVIAVGEDRDVLPETLTAVEDEEGNPSATFELPVKEGRVERVKIPRGQLQLALKTAIEAREGGWWTREQIREDLKMLGLETTNETIDTSLWTYGKKYPLEKRKIGTGKSIALHEYRVIQPMGAPPALDKPSEKVERAQPVRHKDRPTYWEKQAAAAQQEPEPKMQAAVDALVEVYPHLKEEPMAAVQENGHQEMSPRVRNAMFVLRSEKMLSELERTMMQLVQETIKSAREQIAKLVEEEL